MSIFIQTDAAGTGGAGTVQPDQAFIDLVLAANGDTGIGITDVPPNLQQVTFTRTDPGAPAIRIDNLVNTNFGVNPQNIDIIVLAVGSDFTLSDGSLITTRGGTALPPTGSGMPGAGLNPTTSCLVLYDTSDNNGAGYCVARDGTGGTLDLSIPLAVLTYHELSHAFRIVTNALLALTAGCNPASPEENAAITDENDVRTQMGGALRDPNIHCGTTCTNPPGGCCIVASVASLSPYSADVSALRGARDTLLRRSEAGYEFFHELHHSYYGFSPEVCRMMCARPQLRHVIHLWYVRPLVLALGLLREYTLNGLRGAALAHSLEEHLAASPEVGTIPEGDVRFGLAVLEGRSEDTPPGLPLIFSDMMELMRDKARVDRFVRWALVEPVAMYARFLLSRHSGATPHELGRQIEAAFEEWSSRLPLTSVWLRLTSDARRRELAFLRECLLVSPKARAVFDARLRHEFPNDTALARVLDQMEYARAEECAE